MTRPLRVEFPGAVSDVTSQGDRREATYAGDEDRSLSLPVLAQATERLHADVSADCLIGDHYHLLLQRRGDSRSLLTRHLNGVGMQSFSR